MADWYVKEGKDSDVVLSTKACIVRNIKGYNFLPRLDDNESKSLITTVDKAIDKSVFSGGFAEELDKTTVIRLIRQQILGREGSWMANPQRKAFYFNDDASVSIAVGASEHIAVRAMAQGNDTSVYDRAEQVAINLESQLDIAFSDTYGFLTSNIRLAGTGFQMIYTVALPAIAKTEGGLAAIKQRVEQYEWSLTPFTERGELANSNVFLITSVNTLGVSENDILKKGQMLISDIVKAERGCREEIVSKNKDQAEDIYCRSFGNLRYGTLMTRAEAISALSWLRLYHDYDDCGEIKCSWNKINKLTMEIMWEPAAPARRNPGSLVTSQKMRAKAIRTVLKGGE